MMDGTDIHAGGEKDAENSEKENELNDLERKHKELKAREDILDKTIKGLHEFYCYMVKQNTTDCSCEDIK